MNEISIYYAFCTTTIFLFSFYRSNRLKKITYDKKKEPPNGKVNNIVKPKRQIFFYDRDFLMLRAVDIIVTLAAQPETNGEKSKCLFLL